jgi:hypothetical protein
MKTKIDAEKLMECIGQVGDDLVLESETVKLRQNYAYRWTSLAAVFVLATVMVGLYFLLPMNQSHDMLNESMPEPMAMNAPMATPPPVTDGVPELDFGLGRGILPQEAHDDSTWAAGEAGTTVPVIPLPGGSLPDMEFMRIYERAREAMGWFHLTTIPYLELDASNQMAWTDIEGIPYARVTSEDLQDIGMLMDYLGTIFTEDIVNDLISTNRFREYNGDLFTIPADRGTNIFAGGERHEIIWINEYEILYRVIVDIYMESEHIHISGVEVNDFQLVYRDGVWRFNNFHLVR